MSSEELTGFPKVLFAGTDDEQYVDCICLGCGRTGDASKLMCAVCGAPVPFVHMPNTMDGRKEVKLKMEHFKDNTNRVKALVEFYERWDAAGAAVARIMAQKKPDPQPVDKAEK